MLRVVGRSVVRLVPVLFLVSLGSFLLLELVPGDPAVAILGPEGTPEQYAQVRQELGLDRPVAERYVDWVSGAFSGDFGQSLTAPFEDVTEMVRSRLPVTLQIAFVAMVLALVMAVPPALWAAYRQGQGPDRAMSGLAFAAVSIPSFLVGLLLVFLAIFNLDVLRWGALLGGSAVTVWAGSLAVRSLLEGGGRRAVLVKAAVGALPLLVGLYLFWNWPALPRQGFSRISASGGIGESLRHTLLPALTLAIVEAAVFFRVLRSDLIATLREDYILSARARGLPVWRILVVDALRPSSFSLLTVAGLSLGRLLGGTVIVEAIFNLPGMGSLLVRSIRVNDLGVVQAIVLVFATLYVVINLIVDVLYAYLDPRIRRGHV